MNTNKYLAYVLAAIFLLYPYFIFGDMVVPSLILGVVFCCYSMALRKVYIDPLLIVVIVLSFLLFLGAGLLNGGNWSPRVMLLLLVFFFLVQSAFSFVKFCWGKNLDAEMILINILVVNSLLVIFLNFGFIDFKCLYSYVHVNPRVFEYPIVRYPGLTFDAFSYVSTLTAFAFCLLLDKSIKSSLFGWNGVRLLILIVSISISGRAGVVVVLLFLIYRFYRLVKFKLWAMLMAAIMILFLFSIDWGSYEWMKTWAFGFVINFVTGAEYIDSSVLGVQSMLFLPSNSLVGDSVSFISVKSDLGIIRFLNSMGLLGLGGFLLYISFFLYGSIKYRSGFLFFIAVILCGLNFKDVYYVSPYGHTFFAVVVFFLQREKFFREGECDRK